MSLKLLRPMLQDPSTSRTISIFAGVSHWNWEPGGKRFDSKRSNCKEENLLQFKDKKQICCARPCLAGGMDHLPVWHTPASCENHGAKDNPSQHLEMEWCAAAPLQRRG